MRIPSNIRVDNPAFPLLQAHISYQGITTAAGNVLGTTLVDALCSTAGLQPDYVGLSIKLLDGNAAGAVRQIAVHALATGTITVANPWTDYNGAVYQVPAGTRFVIISTGGGGAAPAPVLAPSIGLWMFGECDPAMVASTTILLLTNLAGFPDDIFNYEFWIQVIHNFDAPGTAPEREIRQVHNYVGATGTFTTDAFSANVEAGDLVAVFHESIMSIEIMGFGTLDTSSTTVPADSTRAGLYAWENNDYFKGCLLVPTEGNCRLQPRPIRGYVAATGVFTLDEPFSQAPGLVDYVIVSSDYPVQRLLDIFNAVNALLVLTETGGTLTADGTEQNLYINNAPAGEFEPRTVFIDLENMAAVDSDVTVIRVYYRIVPGGGLQLYDYNQYAGDDGGLPNGRKLIAVTLLPNRYGVQVTLEQTAGVNKDYDWDVHYAA